MKKILLAAVAALAIVGCSQNEEIEKAGEKAEINFGTVVKAGTKAAITETDNFATFTVRAYKTEDKMVAAPALSSEVMNDLLVEMNVAKYGMDTYRYFLLATFGLCAVFCNFTKASS